MPSDKAKGPVRIISDTGTEMMTLESFGREGLRMTVRGAVMGAWPSTMYMEPQDVGRLVRLFVHPQVLGYILLLPFLLLRRRRQARAS
jgi:hypothetical protein